jgi:WD40 repeat protein
VWVVAFSPDGTRLATASSDGTVRIKNIDVPALGWRRLFTPRLRNRFPAKATVAGAVVAELGKGITSIANLPDSAMIATGHGDGYVSLSLAGPGGSRPIERLVPLPGSGWAVLYGEDRYRLHGDPGGRFWWTVGLCRFEPGELDGYGVERV